MKMERLLKVCLLTFGFSLYNCQGTGPLIDDICVDHSDCPLYSECIYRDCQYEDSDPSISKCTCVKGYSPLPSKEECFKVADVGERCGGSILCRPGSHCKKSKCQCLDTYVESKEVPRCKPVLPGNQKSHPIFFAVFNESCDAKMTCYDQFDQLECRNWKCRCKEGLRPRRPNDVIKSATQLLADCVPIAPEGSTDGTC